MLQFYLKKRLVAGERCFDLEVEYALAARSLGVRGPSGSGKSTLIRCLAGLERPDSGFIKIGEETWFDGDRREFAKARTRRVGLVFQDYALFPNMTVLGNVLYANPDEKRDRSCSISPASPTARDSFPGFAGGKKQRTARPGRSPASPSSCCWTSRCRRWTRSCASRSGTSWLGLSA